jgi:hypothetical protein
MSYWYQSTNNNRHPKIKEDTFARGEKEAINLKAGTIVQPIRIEYVSHGSWVLDDDTWCRETQVVCHTEKHGNVIVKISAIDFSK